MYDFCLTFPYGIILCVGGVMRCIMHQCNALTLASFGAGLGLLAAGSYSYHEYNSSTKMTKAAPAISLALASGMSILAAMNFAETKKGCPGTLALLSLGMSLFYAYILIKPSKKKSSSHEKKKD